MNEEKYLISREEFSGYVQRHDADPFAHAAMRDNFGRELLATATSVESRLASLEKWRYFISGGLALLVLELTTFGILIVYKLGL